MFYYTYVLRSLKNRNLYIGFCENVYKRLNEHNKGLVKYTNFGKPWELIYYEACQSKNGAIKREKQLKSGFGRAYLKRRLKTE